MNKKDEVQTDTDLNSEILRKIRNNVRRNNFSKVSDIVLSVIRNENLGSDQKQLLDRIYRDVIEPWIKGKNVESEVPKQYEDMFLEYARRIGDKEEREKALEILDKIKDSQNPRTQKKVKRQLDLMRLTKELMKSETDSDLVDKIVDSLEGEKDEKSYMEVLESLFGKKFSIDQLDLGELEKYLGGSHKEKIDGSTSKKGEYPEELQVANRIRFFKEELNLEPTIRFCDEGIFAGSILLSVKDSDIVIVEKIFDIYADGSYEQNNYASSTYIFPKDKALDLIKFETRKRVKSELKEDSSEKLIPPIQHRKNWKENVKTAIEKGKNRDIEPSVEDEEVTVEDGEVTVEDGETTVKNKGPIDQDSLMNIVAKKIQEYLDKIRKLDELQAKENAELQKTIEAEKIAKEEAKKREEELKKAEEEAKKRKAEFEEAKKRLSEAEKAEEEITKQAIEAIDTQGSAESARKQAEEEINKIIVEKKKIQGKLDDFFDL